MPILYNSQAIIPAPFVGITKTYTRNGAGEIIGTIFSLSVVGTILPGKGSPLNNKTFWTSAGYPADEAYTSTTALAQILHKQDALRELFSEDGHLFEIVPLDGTASMRCNPRVVSITFPEGQWVTRCEYNIQLECDVMYPMSEDTFNQYLSDSQESWSIDVNDTAESDTQQTVLRLSHSVSAVGKRFYDETGTLVAQPWEQARNYVVSRLGFDSTILLSSGVHNLPSYYGGYNLVRTSNIDKGGGGYSATESWIIASGSALEDFTIDTQSNYQDPLKHVTIQGSVTGLEQRDNNYNITTTKYSNAQSKFIVASGLALSRAQNYSGYTLNINPVSMSVGRNPVLGNISYSFEFDDRPSNIVSGALSEVISINDTYKNQIAGIIPVIGRTQGPVLQNIGTSDPVSRQLSIELVMPKPTFGTNTLANLQSAFFGQRPTSEVSGIINACDPNNFSVYQCFITNNQESWDAKSGRYSRNISWIYEV